MPKARVLINIRSFICSKVIFPAIFGISSMADSPDIFRSYMVLAKVVSITALEDLRSAEYAYAYLA